MKQWITLLAATAIFTACSKQDLQEEVSEQNKDLATAAMRSSQQGAYVSGWEQYNSWEKADQGNVTIYTLQRKTGEITNSVTNGGLVLTYAKVATSDPLYSSFIQPKMLPFYFLPESERPRPQTYYFSNVVSNGNITIAYRVPFTKENLPSMAGGASLQKIQFQHVVLSGEFLQSRGLTADNVRNNYTYDQVMNMINQ